MQPFRIEYEPTNLIPCFTIRSRREANTVESVNTRFVNHWQTDPPAMRAESSQKSYMDMNPTSSRLYREDLHQSQPYVIPGSASSAPSFRGQLEPGVIADIKTQINSVLSTIQELETEYQLSIKTLGYDDLRNGVITDLSKDILKRKQEQEELYTLLLTRLKQGQSDSLGDNPYFNKYDVASDSRNIIRELRGTVSEEVVDRGIRESQRLLQRTVDSRWVPQGFAAERGIDSLSAFELMRPKFNNMEKKYF